METEQKFFVYVDYREDNGKPFYVGKGLDKRVKSEERNQLDTNIKNKHGMIRKILFETYSEQEAFDKEVQLIQELKTYVDFDEGGANFTLGGDGTSGYKFTDEQLESLKKALSDPEIRKKISESQKKTWENPEYREKLKSVYNSPEFKKKTSESGKKKWENPEYKEKMIESNKKRWEDPDFKEKRINEIKERWEDPDYNSRLRESIKKSWEKPGHREKISELLKKACENPEIRESRRKSAKKNWEDPEYKKRASENMKLGYSKLTPEQRSERVRKSWETRRLKKLQKEAEVLNSNPS